MSTSLPTALVEGMARHALTPAQQAPLWREYRRRPTPELRERLALANLRLLAAVAGGWGGPADPDDFQAGFFGLLRAVEKYDPARGVSFGTYAPWMIRARINRAQLERCQGLKVATNVAIRLTKTLRAHQHLAAQLGRSPGPGELADWLGSDAGQVEADLMAALARRRPSSLDKPIGDEDGDTFASLIAGEGNPEQALAQAEEQRDAVLRVRDAVAQVLDRRQRHAYASYHLGGETLDAIGARLGVSRERARQLIVKAKRTVEAQLGARPAPLSAARRRLLLTRWPQLIALDGPEPVRTEAA